LKCSNAAFKIVQVRDIATRGKQLRLHHGPDRSAVESHLMSDVINLLPVTPSIDQLGRIIANVAAPAFLLGAVAAFISVLVTRFNRVIERAQFIHSIPDSDSARCFLKDDLSRLRRRAALLNRSLYSAVITAILTTLIIIVAFISSLLHFAHEYGVAILFTVAMLIFCASLVDLARETRISLHDNDLRV
jgi:hypothetical protein